MDLQSSFNMEKRVCLYSINEVYDRFAVEGIEVAHLLNSRKQVQDPNYTSKYGLSIWRWPSDQHTY